MANLGFFQFFRSRLLLKLKDFLPKIFLQNRLRNATIKSKEKLMKKEQKTPKIKLKMRENHENDPFFSDFDVQNQTNQQASNESQNFSASSLTPENATLTGLEGIENYSDSQNFQNGQIRKIKIKLDKREETQEDVEKNQNSEKSPKKRSIFQITAIILTILIVIAIVVEIAVMIWLKNSTDDLNNKNNKLPNQEASISTQI